MSLQLIGVGTRQCRVLAVGNIMDATGFEITHPHQKIATVNRVLPSPP